ncbi:MAG: STAS domain-containing protein [Thermodesulfobacteriota bacterium]
MDIQTNDVDGVLLVKPMEKRIDSGNASLFKSQMVDFIFRDYRYIALDMSEVDFMDSSGLSALLSTLKTINRKGRLALFGVGSNVGKLFSITRLDKGVLNIFPDEQNALYYLQQSG